MATGNRLQTRRDRAARLYVRRQLHAHTEGGREQLGGSHFDAKRLKATGLDGVPVVDLADVGDGARHLVQPSRQELLRSSSPSMRLRTAWAMTWGSWRRFLQVIEPSYRPVHYFTAGGVAIGAAAKDLVRLAALGAEWVRAAGLHTNDTVALLEGATSTVEPWELSGGTRRAGVPLAVVEDPTDAREGHYSVIAGRPSALRAALRDGVWPELRVVLVFGRDTSTIETALKRAGERVAVRRAWAVPGARSVWFECVGGPEHGWHTTDAAELIEVGENDEALWTGLGWAGTVFLRLRTGVRVGALDRAPCAACGHKGTRVFLADGSPALARWLEADERVAEWRLTAAGADVLPVRAGANARLVKEAAAAFPDQVVTVKTKRGWET